MTSADAAEIGMPGIETHRRTTSPRGLSRNRNQRCLAEHVRRGTLYQGQHVIFRNLDRVRFMARHGNLAGVTTVKLRVALRNHPGTIVFESWTRKTPSAASCREFPDASDNAAAPHRRANRGNPGLNEPATPCIQPGIGLCLAVWCRNSCMGMFSVWAQKVIRSSRDSVVGTSPILAGEAIPW